VRRAGVHFLEACHFLTTAASVLSPVDVASISAGNKVFSVTLFGGYSTRVLVPAAQMRPRLPKWTAAECAFLPSVSLTALYALSLGEAWPLTELLRLGRTGWC